jgi:hypothetical protein
MGGSLHDGMVLLSTTTGAVAPYRHDLVPLGGVAARSGSTGARRRGPFALGRLGGPVARPAEDGCD